MFSSTNLFMKNILTWDMKFIEVADPSEPDHQRRNYKSDKYIKGLKVRFRLHCRTTQNTKR